MASNAAGGRPRELDLRPGRSVERRGRGASADRDGVGRAVPGDGGPHVSRPGRASGHRPRAADAFRDTTGIRCTSPTAFPAREATTVEGHAVRALYLAAGVADVVAEGGDDAESALARAQRRQWDHMVSTKTYLTGGLGSRWDGEAFGDPFELPPDRAYGETCAAIASIQWSWRLLLATGEARYADLIERTLYNGFIAGVSTGGDEFFYVNALQVRSAAEPGRQPQPGLGPTPLVRRRLLPAQHHAHAVLPAVLPGHPRRHGRADPPVRGRRHPLRRRRRTGGDRRQHGLSLDATIDIEVTQTPAAEWTLALRIPAWCRSASVTVQGDESAESPAPGATPGSYARLTRRWAPGDRVRLELPMPPRLTVADDRVDAVRGCVAIERGPLVYCVEQIDQAAGVTIEDLAHRRYRAERGVAGRPPGRRRPSTSTAQPTHAQAPAPTDVPVRSLSRRRQPRTEGPIRCRTGRDHRRALRPVGQPGTRRHAGVDTPARRDRQVMNRTLRRGHRPTGDASCSRRAGPERCRSPTCGSPGFGDDARGTVVVWCRAATAPATQLIAQRFNASHDGLKIKVNPIPDAQYITKVATAIRANDVPDLLDLDDINSTLLATHDALTDLTPLIDALPYQKRLSPAHLNLATLNGRNYAIPFAADVSMLFYNKELFRRAGITNRRTAWPRPWSTPARSTPSGVASRASPSAATAPGSWASRPCPTSGPPTPRCSWLRSAIRSQPLRVTPHCGRCSSSIENCGRRNSFRPATAPRAARPGARTSRPARSGCGRVTGA